jgi:Transglutaminase-like superfamily
MRRLADLRRLSPAERRVLALAWILLLVTPVLLRLVPLRRMLISARAGRRPRLAPERVAELVDIAARRAPGARCLPVAVVTSWLLARQGTPATLQIGVARHGGALGAHAWIECAGLPLGGARGIAAYQPILTMASAAAHEAHR